jgi:DMSO/TMAO reductase YedYZ molybdopterin-dependent catalytic subunit
VSSSSRLTEDFSWRPTPLAALESPEIPTGQHFVRDHFPVPTVDSETWLLEVNGETDTLRIDLDRLRAMPTRSLRVVLECAGHRRDEFDPLPYGVPWGCGAVGEAHFTGPSLATLLRAAGIPPGTREVVLEGADHGPVEGFKGTHNFARSLPLAKALDRDVLLAYEMNGEPIAPERGGPVRAIVPGWYATDSVKWLSRVGFTAEEFDGVFQANDYRLRVPGEPGPGRRMTELPVNALITSPEDGERLSGPDIAIKGIAWGGAGGVEQVQVCIDGALWEPARLDSRRGTYARVAWSFEGRLGTGPHEIACRAFDCEGQVQPDRPPVNVRGYANNAVHRVLVRVGP